MHSVYETFLECGWASYLILLMSILGIGLGIVALILAFIGSKAAKLVGALSLGLAMLAMGTGLFGTMSGRRLTDEAVSSGAIDPAMADKIREAGYAEAKQCTNLGVGLGAWPLLVGGLALTIAFLRKDPQDAAAG